jgi:hypothetical protein
VKGTTYACIIYSLLPFWGGPLYTTFGMASRTGIPILLQIITSGETLLCQASFRLAEAHVVEAGDLMIERLRTLQFTQKLQVEGILCLLKALNRLGRILPSDLVERFQSPEAPWTIRASLEKLYQEKHSE